MKPVAKSEEESQPLIDGSDLFPRKFTEDTPDSPFVNRSQMVDRREELLARPLWPGARGG
jgi:hypothetical protein